MNLNKKKEIERLLILAILAGRIMLKNGAETYRVEDTIIRICKSRNVKYVEAFVTPTGIFVSLEYDGEVISYLQRIKNIKIDLNKIDIINNFSRKFVNTNMSIEKGIAELKKIDKIENYKDWTRILLGSIAAAFFSLLFGGTFFDFIASFLVSIIVVISVDKLNSLDTAFFVSILFGASLATILAILTVKLNIGKNTDKIIIGSIMTLVPGVPITNAIRDTMSGDYVSGLSRGMEAIITALAIAFGVGAVLRIYFKGMM